MQANLICSISAKSPNHLTRIEGKIFGINPGIWCLNFEPTKNFRAFILNSKLLGWGPLACKVFCAKSSASPHWLRTFRKNFARRVSDCIPACFKTCYGHFDPILSPVVKSGHRRKQEKTENLRTIFLIFRPRLVDFGDIKSTIRENACTAV